MADESIVIEVRDSVDSSIAVKIRGIATEARNAEKDLGSLKKQLSSLDVSKLQNLSTVSGTASGALSRLALANQNLATAQARTAAATANAAAAQDKATLAAQRLADAQQRATARVQAAALAAANAATTQARLNQGLDKSAVSFNRAGLSVKQYNASMRGVPAQITDIVVSLQGGQKPLTVLLQQGGQLKDMFGGIRPAAAALTRSLIAMINPWTLLAAGVAAYVFIVGKAESSLRTINGLVAQFTATGRTDVDNSFITKLRKEIQLLPGVSKTAATAVIQEFANIRDISGSTMKAASGTVADLAAALGTDAPAAAKKLAEALYDPIKGAQDLDKALGFLSISDFKAIKNMDKLGQTAKAQQFLIDKLKASIDGLAYNSMTPLQKATNDLGNSWSKFMDKVDSSEGLRAAATLFAGLINSISRLIDKLSELSTWKPPSWVQFMMDNGPNSWLGVSGLFGGKSNTGGASGGWSGSGNASAAQSQTTKFKTDAAGITGKKDNSAENRATALEKINAQLSNEIKLMGMLGPEREKQEMFDRIQEGLLGRKIKLNAAETATIKEKIAAIVQGAALAAETNRIYEESIEPLRTYNSVTQATADLLAKKAISETEANKQNLIAFERYANIIDPLREYNTQLDQELKLSKLTSDQNEIESSIMSLQNDLLQKGITLRGDELNVIRERLKENQNAAKEQSAYNEIYDKTTGALTNIVKQTLALNRAQTDGLISAEMYQIKLNQLGVSAANIRLAMGGTDFADVALSAMGRVVEGYEGMLSGLTDTFGNFFVSLQDGFANSVGRAVVYSENLGEALQSVAREALSSLIGALVKLGIQYVVNAALGQGVAAASTAANVALAATTAAAWAPAAAMASLASFGANAAPAAAALTTTTGLASALAMFGAGFQSGGYTGNMATDAVAGVVHGKEYVFDAAATNRIGAGNLEALRSGAVSLNSNSSSSKSASIGGSAVNVVVENYGTPQTYEQVPTMTPGEVRMIARDVVAKESPDVIASNIANPNSVVRKSMAANTNVTRK